MITTSYPERNKIRQTKLEEATMAFVQYFIDLGDDLATAQAKVAQVSTEVSVHLFPYILGNTQPLLDALNASALPQMDAAAKAKIVGDLTF